MTRLPFPRLCTLQRSSCAAHHVFSIVNLHTRLRHRADSMDRAIRHSRTRKFVPQVSCLCANTCVRAPFLQAYSLYLRIFYSSKVSKQRSLKSDILATKAELLQTSSQDQFAKWAKLRRKVDKGLAELEKLSTHFLSESNSCTERYAAQQTASSARREPRFPCSSIPSFGSLQQVSNSCLDGTIGSLLCSTSRRDGLVPRHGFCRSPSLPLVRRVDRCGSLHFPLTHLLSGPGSVSCGAWQMACRRVIKVGERVVKDLASTSCDCNFRFCRGPECCS